MIKKITQTAMINIVFAAVCVIFLIKLRWPKNKSLYEAYTCCGTLPRSRVQYNYKLVVIIDYESAFDTVTLI